MSRLVYTLPAPKVKGSKSSTSTDTIKEGPVEFTTAAGRPCKLFIIDRLFANGNVGENMLAVEAEGKAPMVMGLSKKDVWEAAFAEARRRNW